MIVIIGSPAARPVGSDRLVAEGIAADIGRSAAAGGAAVQIVGRVGDDDAGEALLLDLAAANVGHVAVLRTPSAATPLTTGSAPRDADDDAPAAALDEATDVVAGPPSGLSIDAADVELALRYLPDYRVIVVTPGLDTAALGTVVAAAGWSGARLVIVDDGTPPPDGLPADATVLAQPADPDRAFAAVVARYAVELDRGVEPGVAFAAASNAVGWQPVDP